MRRRHWLLFLGFVALLPKSVIAQDSGEEAVVTAEDEALFGVGGVALSDDLGGSPLGIPDEYAIQVGDTLWDICARILGDPFQWPKLWSFNQYITNPHFIYPGNVVRFYAGTDIEPPHFEVTRPGDAFSGLEGEAPFSELASGEMGNGGQEEASLGDPFAQDLGIPTAGGPLSAPAFGFDSLDISKTSYTVNLRQEGFIAETKIASLGEVHKAESPVAHLSKDDEVYLRFRAGAQSVKVGSRFTVYRQIRRVRHPINKKQLGYLIKILGEVDIVEINENGIVTGLITASFDSISRGDPVTEWVELIKKVNPTPSAVRLTGFVIDSMNGGSMMIAQRDVLYIDRGAKDGVRIGNIMEVIRSGDGITGEGNRLPDEVIGKLIIIGTRANTSTAVVTQTVDALHRGDRVRMH